MFTGKHYKIVASEISNLNTFKQQQVIELVHLFVDIFKPDNSNFDERKFVEACGIKWEDYS